MHLAMRTALFVTLILIHSPHFAGPVQRHIERVMPRDGDYIVRIQQSVPRDSQVNDLAHIGTFVRPLVAFPPGGPAGRPLKIRRLAIGPEGLDWAARRRADDCAADPPRPNDGAGAVRQGLCHERRPNNEIV